MQCFNSSYLRAVSLTCCLLLEVVPSPTIGQSGNPAKTNERQTLVVLIGGMDSDPTPSQIAGTAGRGGNSGLYRLMGDLKHDRIDVEYFNWNGTRAGKIKSKTQADYSEIIDVIHNYVDRHSRSRVVLVGNSWGGHSAWDVCRTLVESPLPVPIDCAIFLDPSSSGRAETARPKTLPININRAINLYTRNVFVWGRWPNEKRINNIDLGDPQLGFLQKGRAAYDSRFDFQAHVAAEWDEKIHAAIKQVILNVASGDATSDGPKTSQISVKPPAQPEKAAKSDR